VFVSVGVNEILNVCDLYIERVGRGSSELWLLSVYTDVNTDNSVLSCLWQC